MAKYEDGVMYYFIINPASQSDRGYKIWKKIEQRLVRDGVEYQAYLTEYAGQATEYARKLTSHCKEARVIVVVGGDGTMNEVVDGIVSCDIGVLSSARGSGWMRKYASICSVRRSKISATGFICGDCRTGYWDLYSI